ncbi:hypothetical protein QVD17_20633 [Tagetes erecta]|uniref:Uncharacterized protein n=1 Tax=Tagetes erecta TaxID=13708 RepID=A0AAD8NXE9_TARER|nr:hypothetical protein QVD17_20633 [Tagetes erecta]
MLKFFLRIKKSFHLSSCQTVNSYFNFAMQGSGSGADMWFSVPERSRKPILDMLDDDKQVPKGCLAVNVGEANGEQQRFVVPVIWFNHPLFMELLKEAENEFGFEQKGTITIPCNVHRFCSVISRIIHHYRNHHQYFGCFRVWAS